MSAPTRRPSGRSGRARPRYGRIAALAAALSVTLVAGLGGLGLLTTGSPRAEALARPASYTRTTTPGSTAGSTATAPPAPHASPHPTGPVPRGGASDPSSPPAGTTPTGIQRSGGVVQTALPARSGSGKRVVFSQGLQRVWLVDANGTIARTYLVSGSKTHNLQPGTYAITRRERHAVGIGDSGTMEYFDIFTAGPTGAAIGFHSIPVKNGRLVQTVAQLGTPQSHGCIRQWKPDAVALWKFAQKGTTVVVVA